MPLGGMQARGDVVAQVVVADGGAGGQPAVAKQQKGLAFAHPLDLARERFEKRRGPHDGIAHAGVDQRLLKGQLGVLESQQRLLHADRRQQHEMCGAGVPGGVQRI